MESMIILNKIKRTKYITLSILVSFIIFFSLLFVKIYYGSIFPFYLPNQEKIINISKYKNENISIVLESKYKNDFDVEAYDNKGKLIKASSTYNGKQNNYITGYGYYYNSRLNDKIKIKIKNKTKKIIFTGIGAWHVYPVDWKRI